MSKPEGKSLCFANFVVISIIPLLFFVAMILGYLNIIPIKVPLTSVALIAFILVVFLLFAKLNANYVICQMKSDHLSMRRELEDNLNSAKLRIYEKQKSIFDMDSFFKSYYSTSRNNNFVTVASSIFPMLGILGTFIAIAISMPNFSVADPKALDGEITTLLSGVGSAFYASIYGILLSLIWTYFEKSGLSKSERFFREVRSSYEVDIWSENELKIYRYSQYEVRDKKFLDALERSFNLDIIEQLNEKNLQSFQKIIEKSGNSLSNLALKVESSSTQLNETLQAMDDSRTAIEAKNEIEKILVEFTQATRSLEKSSKIFNAQLTSSLDKTFQKIDVEIAEIVIKLADFATHVSLQSEEVQNSIRTYHRMITTKTEVK